jgi:hypothetical protein
VKKSHGQVDFNRPLRADWTKDERAKKKERPGKPSFVQ